jgi:hypothetical protein
MGRPRKKVDTEVIERLAALHLTVEEIALVTGVSKRTLERRFDVSIKRGRDQAKAAIRRRQFEAAMAGNTTMLIWLGKQYLGQRDQSTVANVSREFDSGEGLADRILKDEKAAALCQQLLERIRS